MNRRELLIGAGAAGVVASLGAMPTFAARVPGVVAHPRITYGPDAAFDPHAAMMARSFVELIDDRVLYAWNAEFGYAVKLTDPHFHISTGKRVFNWMTGYTDEVSVQGAISELGVHIATVGVGTSIGYEEYHGYTEPRDKKRFPDYFVRKAHLSYDEMTAIEPLLPKDHIGPDLRWFEAFKKNKEES